MNYSRPALRYAKAVFNLAKENNVDQEVNQDMILILKTINDNPDINKIFKSSIIKSVEKIKILNSVFKNNINNITKKVFKLLELNKRLMILDNVANKYIFIYNNYKNIQIAKVTTATVLTDVIKQKIQTKIIELTGNKAIIKSIVNPEIIGGLKLQVGDMQYDASISNELNKLKYDLKKSY